MADLPLPRGGRGHKWGPWRDQLGAEHPTSESAATAQVSEVAVQALVKVTKSPQFNFRFLSLFYCCRALLFAAHTPPLIQFSSRAVPGAKF